MLIFTILMIALITLIAVISVVALVGGAVFLWPVVEVFAFVAIIVLIVRAIFKRKKK